MRWSTEPYSEPEDRQQREVWRFAWWPTPMTDGCTTVWLERYVLIQTWYAQVYCRPSRFGWTWFGEWRDADCRAAVYGKPRGLLPMEAP